MAGCGLGVGGRTQCAAMGHSLLGQEGIVLPNPSSRSREPRPARPAVGGWASQRLRAATGSGELWVINSASGQTPHSHRIGAATIVGNFSWRSLRVEARYSHRRYDTVETLEGGTRTPRIIRVDNGAEIFGDLHWNHGDDAVPVLPTTTSWRPTGGEDACEEECGKSEPDPINGRSRIRFRGSCSRLALIEGTDWSATSRH